MSVINSNWTKKIIIVLIVLLLFNVAYPSLTYAWDIGGVLLSPIYIAIASTCLVTDLGFGFMLFAQEFFGNTIDGIVEKILYKGEANGTQDFYGKQLSDWFVGPDTIFMGRIPSLNANIFKHLDRTEDDILKDVSEAVAKFYVILRNIAAMIMLAGLIYTGIQILLSSNIPTKKTQYLMLLQDWIIGMALLIFSHIIMIFILNMAETISLYLAKTVGSGSLKWELIKKMAGSFESTTQLISFLLYGWLQFLTIVFAISYFKRYFWTCILIVFAPVFCVMYAFGQQTKQIYSNWLKEFFLNAFVQPFHIIIYTVLVTFPLAITSDGGGGFIESFNYSFQNGPKLVYALMGMSMIRPAEKYLRRLFGFDKGIANMASYDSGKQTIDAAVKGVAAAVTTAVKVAAIAYTGGAAAGLIGGAGATGVAGAASGALGEAGATGALGEAGNVLGNAGELGDAGNMLNDAGNVLGEMGDAAGDSPWITEGWDTDSQGRYFNPYNEEWYTEDELNAGRDLPAYMDQDDFSEGDRAALAEGIGDQLEKTEDDQLGKAEGTQDAQALEQGNDAGKDEKETTLNAANINIGSANIEMGSQNIGNQQLGVGENQDDETKNPEKLGGTLSDEVIEDTKRLLNDPSLGLTEEEKQEYLNDPQKLADDLPGMKRNLTREMKKGDLGKLISNIDGAIGERMADGVEADSDEYGGDPHAERRQRVRDLLSGSIKGKANKKEFDFVTSHADDQELAALEQKGEMASRRKLMDKVSSGLKEGGYNAPTIGATKDSGEGSEKNGTTGSSNKQTGGSISAGNITINAGSVNLEGGKTTEGADKGPVKAEIESTIEKDETINQQVQLEKGEEEISLVERLGVFGESFKNNGGLEKIGELGADLFEGLHSIGDTLYVDGTAPTSEWKGNAQWVRGNIKQAGDEREKNLKLKMDNWANNSQNRKSMSDHYYETKYLPEETKKYEHKLKTGEVDMNYVQAQAREKSDAKAKSALKDMSEYVRYGVTDVKVAYQLYENANRNGFSPEQSIRNEAGYSKFNSNAQVVAQINASPVIEGDTYTSVEQAIPAAREYYDAGYTNVNEMAWLQYMADKLGKDPEFAMRIDETLKKKGKGGKISYNGSDAAMRKAIDEINSHYGG